MANVNVQETPTQGQAQTNIDGTTTTFRGTNSIGWMSFGQSDTCLASTLGQNNPCSGKSKDFRSS